MNRLFKYLSLAVFAVFIFALAPVAGAVTFGPEGGIEHRSRSVSPPGAALDNEGRVYLAWIEEESDINSLYVAVSTDKGKTFSEGVKINGKEDEPSSIHQSPSLAVGPKGEVYVAWTSRNKEGGYTSDLRVSRSVDLGKSFSPAVKVNDNSNPASIGFESMAVGADGSVHLAWLDGRNKGGASAYYASSVDGGKNFGKNILIDGNACPCCRTAITAGPDNTLYVSWRKVYEKNIREIVISRSGNGGKTFSTPVNASNDRWEIPGCPHRGPSTGIDGKGDVIVFWYAEGEGDPRVYLGRPGDGGFTKEAIEHKRNTFPDNPALAAYGEKVFLAWQEITPVYSNIVFESIEGGGRKREQLNGDIRKASYPVIAVNGKGEVLVAWQKMEIRKARSAVRLGK